MTQNADEILLKAISTGDRYAYTELVKRHSTKFYSLAYRITGQKEDAEDIVQSAFIKLWQYPNLWSESKSTLFTTWFYCVVLNKCIDYKRKNKFSSQIDTFNLYDTADLPDEVLLQKEKDRLFNSAFMSLSIHHKSALHLCYFEHYSNQHAAQIMGVKLKAFQSILVRAKQSMRDKILELETAKGSKK